MVVEGLNHRPLKELKELEDEAIKLTFNYVPLTYRTIEENFYLLGLKHAKVGLTQYNHFFLLNKIIVELYKVIDVLWREWFHGYC